jgi:hypothetical protein
MRTTRSLLTVALIAATACGNPTSPADAPQKFPVEANIVSAVKPVNTNEWQTWNFQWFSLCSNTQFVNGLVNVHLQHQWRTTQDGIVIFTEHLNVGDGRAWDSLGNEYILQNISTQKQITLPQDDYTMQFEAVFRVVSRGSAPNEVLNMKFNLQQTAGVFTFSFSSSTQCKG